ncbi:uncharacterized protein LY89DRAFT_682536 [Mollisia scopiformis]|uniref:Uncharacterized protein n=1 Tax=Mollisia scopiformis TaxID=149040 RepID=A0A194XHM5_MOLSC|nr:uncharacterized protein LY89DRAFT_682536 [Mollisia scopiformis]KUJ19636.1 hypothetical protein LY89DRAFT_682536 [Mollisia scopiformis]
MATSTFHNATTGLFNATNTTVDLNNTCTNSTTWDSFCIEPGFIAAITLIVVPLWLGSLVFAIRCSQVRWITKFRG